MKSFLYLALLFVVLFYGILLILVPLVLKWQFRYRARILPRIVGFENLPEAAQRFIEEHIDSIEVWGFDLLNFLNLGISPGGTGPFLALLSNPYTREWATISYVVSNGSGRGYLEFITHWSDGVQVDTNTNALRSVLFPTPNRHVFRFPQVRDVFTLYGLHRMLVERTVGRGYPLVPPRGQEVTEWQRRLERYGPHQRLRGYMYLDGRDQYYRLTWKGAMVGGWRSIWPVPLLRVWRMKRRSERILRENATRQQPDPS
jgi:hypothetical protein